MSVCDFCEEEDETVSFDPDWDAMICDECLYDLEDEYENSLSKVWW